MISKSEQTYKQQTYLKNSANRKNREIFLVFYEKKLTILAILTIFSKCIKWLGVNNC